MSQNCQLCTWNGYKVYSSVSDFCLCFIMFHVCFVFHEYDSTRGAGNLRLNEPLAKIAGCSRAGNAGNVFSATNFKGNR